MLKFNFLTVYIGRTCFPDDFYNLFCLPFYCTCNLCIGLMLLDNSGMATRNSCSGHTNNQHSYWMSALVGKRQSSCFYKCVLCKIGDFLVNLTFPPLTSMAMCLINSYIYVLTDEMCVFVLLYYISANTFLLMSE